MKKLLSLLLLIPSLCFGQGGAEPEANHLWEAAAFGDMPGLTHVRLSGWNAAITSTYEAMWGESAAYTPLAAAMSTPYCASSSTNDVLTSGSGAWTARVYGVNTSFAAFTEDINLNGQTSVNLATSNILFIYKIEILTANTGGVNAGIIQCGTGANTSGDPAVTHQYLGVTSATAIPAAGAGFGNVSESFMYAVPDGYKLICTNIQCASVFATAAAGHVCAIDGYTNLSTVFKRYFIQMQHNTGSNPSTFSGYVTFPEKTLIIGKMAGMTGSDVGPASMNADCILISEDWEDTAQGIF